jgi:hypothetical protein
MANSTRLFREDEEADAGRSDDDQLNNIVGDPSRSVPDEAADYLGSDAAKQDLAEHNASDGAANFLKNQESQAAGEPGRSLLKAGGDKAGGAASSLAGVAAAEDGDGPTFNPTDKGSWGQRLRGLASQNKRRALFGGGGVTVVLVMIFLGGGFLENYEIVTIEKDLQAYENKEVKKGEQDASKHIATSLICRLADPNSIAARLKNCKNVDPKEQKDKIAQQQEEQQLAGEANGQTTLASEIDNFNFTDPKIEAALSERGINVITKDGGFGGFTNQGGEDITGQIATDDQLFQEFSNALPEGVVGQEQTLRTLLAEHAGVSWRGLPDTANDNVPKDVEGDIIKGNAGEAIGTAASTEETQQPPPAADHNPQDSSNYTQGQAESGLTGNALSATEQAIESGKTEAAAIKAGEGAFKLGDPLTLTTIAVDACSVKQAADQGAKNRVPLIEKLLIRHPSLIATLADQAKTGKLTGKEINQFMIILSGDPSVLASLANPNPEAAKSYNQSAAWQRIMGKPVDSNPKDFNYTPDIADSAKPSANAGTKVVKDIDSVVNKIPGANFVCAAANNPFGGFAIAAFGIVAQAGADAASFGTAEAATLVVVGGVQITLQTVVIPEILQYFTPVGLYGLESAVQWLNNADAGQNLVTNQQAQREGGAPETTPQANQTTLQAVNWQNKLDGQQSWSYRTFALSNPHSLAARLALDLPVGQKNLVSNIASYFIHLPQTMGHLFSTLLTPHKVFAAEQAQNPGTPYGITQYALPAENYDPIANEQYLLHSISYGGHAAETRLQMLGNPMQYPNATEDSSTTDLLHCFTQNPNSSIANMTPSTNDKICGSEGSYDLNNDPPVPITNTNVAMIYCMALNGETKDDAATEAANNTGCVKDMLQEIAANGNDDIGHFRQYILDTHVMGNFAQFQQIVDTQP